MTAGTETPEEVVEGQAREIEPVGNGAMERPAVAPPVSLEVTPAASAGELVARMDVIKQAMKSAMQPDVDYGVIPGTGSKPTLLKPGAEKLGVLFQLDLQPENEKLWHDDGHLTVISRVTAYHAPTGARLGGGEGICTTREKKYAKRRADRLCPQCGEATVLESRDRETKKPDGSLFCWKKKGGCGANFPAGSEEAKALLAVKPGDVDNPDLADTYNTVLKMAEKRGRVDAVLAVTGASALFTQDQDDLAQPVAAPEPQPEPVPPIPADALLDAAKGCGLTLVQIHNWLSANGVTATPLESEQDALTALDRLDADGRRKLAAGCAAFKAEQEAKAREASQAADAEQAAA